MANPWYAFYPGDYGRDTAHLSLIEDGAYRRLLDYYYSTGRPLPGDVVQLHRICRVSGSKERAAVRKVLEQFFTLEGGVYRQKRVDAEIAKQAEYKEKLSESGRRGAQKRWSHSHGHPNGDPNGELIAEPQPQPHKEYKTTAPQAVPSRGTRIPDNFSVKEEHRAFARKHGLPNPDTCVAEFIDYWRAVPGQRGVKLDWDATFRNRLRELGKRGRLPQSSPGNLKPPSALELHRQSLGLGDSQ
jgi:uncharacterized protein YdaU (DUF1376 family)